MADEIPSSEGLGAGAPAKLADALKRVQPPPVNVPPQVDTAALSRAHLHFARVRQQAGGFHDAAPNQDLPLAALKEDRSKRPASFAAPGGYGMRGSVRKLNWSRIIAVCAIVIALVAIGLLVRSLSSSRAGRRGASPDIRQTTPP